MAFENVFGNVNYGMIPQARQQEAGRLQEMIGRGLAMGERAQDRELKARQLEMDADKFDLKQLTAEVLYKQAQKIPLTPEDTAVLSAYDRLASSKPSVDVWGNRRAGMSLGDAVGVQPEFSSGQPVQRPLQPSQNQYRGDYNPNTPVQNQAPLIDAGQMRPQPLGDKIMPANALPPPSQAAAGLPVRPEYSDEFSAPSYMGAKGELEELDFAKGIAEKQVGSNITLNEYVGKKDIDNIYANEKLNKATKAEVDSYETTLGQLVGSYEELINAGGAVETLQEGYTLSDVIRNAKASAKTSDLGVKAGEFIGGGVSGAVNFINSNRPVLFGKLRTAMNLTGKELDTKSERDFYMKTITDPKTDLMTNLKVMRNLSARYGTGLSVERIDGMISRLSNKASIKEMSGEDRLKDYQDLMSRVGK